MTTYRFTTNRRFLPGILMETDFLVDTVAVIIASVGKRTSTNSSIPPMCHACVMYVEITSVNLQIVSILTFVTNTGFCTVLCMMESAESSTSAVSIIK